MEELNITRIAYPRRAYILDLLKSKYPNAINPKLLSLQIYQAGNEINLEKIFRSNPEEIISESMDFIADDDFIPLEPTISSDYFNPQLELEENVERFINGLDKQSIEMCFDGIFHEENSGAKTMESNE